MKYADIDKFTSRCLLKKIPGNSEIPPDVLVELVQSGKVQPCKTLDLGCGAGNYAIYLAYLASKGFEVTDVDSSPTAIKITAENAQKKGVWCRFIVADLLGDLHELNNTLDFCYDWEVFHPIFPENRENI